MRAPRRPGTDAGSPLQPGASRSMMAAVLQLFEIGVDSASDVAPNSLPTPLGEIWSWVEVDGEPVTLSPPTVAWRSGDGAAAQWRTEHALIELVAGAPRYPDVTFEVDDHRAVVWRVHADAATSRIGFATVLRADVSAATAPVDTEWVFGTAWESAAVRQGLGTSNADALAIRAGAGGWLPERYLDVADPTRPGVASFLQRGPNGLRATFDDVRAGERFEHHAVVAWAPPGRAAAIDDALDVEATGVLRACRTT